MEPSKSSGRIVVSTPGANSTVGKPTLPILGKIKCGEKNESGIPRSLGHFIADGQYATLFKDIYGENPESLSVIFVSDDEREVCNERFEMRSTDGRLIARGNGKDFEVWNSDTKKYDWKSTEDETERAVIESLAKKWSVTKNNRTIKPEWKRILTLRFVLPKIKTVFGLWQFETRAEASSIPNIRDTFDNVKEMAGTVMRIPFDLTIKKVKTQKPGDTSNFPVVSLIPNIGVQTMNDMLEFVNAGLGAGEVSKKLMRGQSPDEIRAEIAEKSKLQLGKGAEVEIQEEQATQQEDLPPVNDPDISEEKLGNDQSLSGSKGMFDPEKLNAQNG